MHVDTPTLNWNYTRTHCQVSKQYVHIHVVQLRICKSSLCPSVAPSSNPLTIHCNHCVFSVIFRELARVSPLYDTVNFNCLGLSALTPVQPPEGTRELTGGAYGIEWEKATVVHLSGSGSSMTAHTASDSDTCSQQGFLLGARYQQKISNTLNTIK